MRYSILFKTDTHIVIGLHKVVLNMLNGKIFVASVGNFTILFLGCNDNANVEDCWINYSPNEIYLYKDCIEGEITLNYSICIQNSQNILNQLL